jgi:sulfide:quinone oxidoreductase
MAKIIQLESEVFVAPQLVEADFAEIAALGFRSVVNNRPDGEAADQLPAAAAESAASRHGLEFRYQPVANLHVTDDDVVDAFAELLVDLPRPVLFYCRTGTRCSILWAQASVAKLGVDRTLEIVTEAGYDLEPLREQLEERAENAGASRPVSAELSLGAQGSQTALQS